MALRLLLRNSLPFWEAKLLPYQLRYKQRYTLATRGLATSAGGAGGPSDPPNPTEGEAEDDFEIDLISMRRAPKGKKKKEFTDPNSFKRDKPFKSISISRSSVLSVINGNSLRLAGERITIKSENAIETSLVDIDLVALDKFVAKYKWQLQQFQKFIAASYDGKVTHFGQLSTNEFKNSIQIFEDLNKRGKFFVYSEGFQEMIQYLRRLLLTYKDIPVYLDHVLQKWHLDVDKKVFRFMPELNSVSEYISFDTSTGQQISDYIMKELAYLNITRHTIFDAEAFPHGEEICPEEMLIIVQAHRYRELSKIVESVGDQRLTGLLYVMQGRVGYENGDVDLSQSGNHFNLYALVDLHGFKLSILKESENLEFFLSEIYNKGYHELFEVIYNQACHGILSSKNFNLQRQFLIKEKGQNGPLAVVDLVGRETTATSVDIEIAKNLDDLKAYQGTKPYYSYSANELLNSVSKWTGRLSVFDDGGPSLGKFQKWVETVLLYELRDPSYFDSLIFDEKLDEVFNRRTEIEAAKTELPTSEARQPYVQIPDHIKLHDFSKELTTVQEYLGCKFGELQKEDILAACHQLVPLHEDLELRKLAYKLNELFKVNYGETSVLDTVINSHNEFEAFEKKLAQMKPAAAVSDTESVKTTETPSDTTSTEYKQIPDGFYLEEFSTELKEVKDYLKIKSYSDVDCAAVLAALEDLTNENLTFDAEKRNVYAKLFRNLSYLFKHNNLHTFVLDNVIQNSEVFENFEKSKASSNGSQDVGQDNHLFTNYGSTAKLQSLLFWEWPVLEKVVSLNNWDQFTDTDFKKVSSHDFNIALSSSLEKIKKLEGDISVEEFTRVVAQLKEFNEEFHRFPYVFHLLMTESKIEPNVSLQLIDDIIEFAESDLELASLAASNDHDIAGAFVEEEVVSKSLESETVPPVSIPRNEEEKTNKFDMGEFKDSVEKVAPTESKQTSTSSKSKLTYHKSDELLSSLTKNEEPADFNPGQYDFPKVSEGISTGREPSLEKLEGYLKDAKKDKEFKKEMKFREAKAYEWSKSMCNSNRTLEAKNFFSPLSSFGGESSRKSQYEGNFGGEQMKNEYLLLTQDEQTIISRENPLGANYVPEDMFVTLNKFPKEDLRKLIKTVKKFQRKNWKLIGGGGQREILVFRRRKSNRRSSFFRRLKSLLATTGAVFIGLMGINYLLEENGVPYGPQQENEPRPYTVVGVEPKEGTREDSAPQPVSPVARVENGVEGIAEDLRIPEDASTTVSSDKKDSGWKNWFWKTN